MRHQDSRLAAGLNVTRIYFEFVLIEKRKRKEIKINCKSNKNQVRNIEARQSVGAESVIENKQRFHLREIDS